MQDDCWLIIEDDPVFANLIQKRLTHLGYLAEVANDEYSALSWVSRKVFSHIVLDLKLDNQSGLLLIPEIKRLSPQCRLLMLTGYASIATAVEAIKLGADNYLPKPASTQQIIDAISPPHDNSGVLSHSVSAEKPMSPQLLEWEHIQTVFKQHNQNVSATARALNMHRRTLQRKLAKKRANLDFK